MKLAFTAVPEFSAEKGERDGRALTTEGEGASFIIISYYDRLTLLFYKSYLH